MIPLFCRSRGLLDYWMRMIGDHKNLQYHWNERILKYLAHSRSTADFWDHYFCWRWTPQSVQNWSILSEFASMFPILNWSENSFFPVTRWIGIQEIAILSKWLYSKSKAHLKCIASSWILTYLLDFVDFNLHDEQKNGSCILETNARFNSFARHKIPSGFDENVAQVSAILRQWPTITKSRGHSQKYCRSSRPLFLHSSTFGKLMRSAPKCTFFK